MKLPILFLLMSALVAVSTGIPLDNEQAEENAIKKPIFPLKFYSKALSYFRQTEQFANYTLEGVIDYLDDLERWEVPKDLLERFPYYLSGYDFEQRPLFVLEVGKYNLKDYLMTYPNGAEEFEKYWAKSMIHTFKSMESNETGRMEAKEHVCILDFEGFPMDQVLHAPTVNAFVKVLTKFLRLLLVSLVRIVGINVNYPSEVFLNLVRPIAGSIFERFEVYGSTREKWVGVLRRLFPPEAYSPKYGGSPDWKPLQMFG